MLSKGLFLVISGFIVALLAKPTAAWTQPAAFEGENLLISISKDAWQVGFSNKKPGFTMVEYVPPGQTVENWERMLTIQIFHNNPMTLAQFSGGMRGSMEMAKPCDEASVDPAGSGTVNGYDSAQLLLICTKHKQTGKGEFTLIRAIRGRDSLYVVQRAWRGSAYSRDNVPVEQDEFKQWVSFLGGVSLCDTRDGQHPCPGRK